MKRAWLVGGSLLASAAVAGLAVFVVMRAGDRPDCSASRAQPADDRGTAVGQTSGRTPAPAEAPPPSAPAASLPPGVARSGFFRPEDRGEDLSKWTAPQLVDALEGSSDKIVRRKAALALGNSAIAGTLDLSAADAARLESVVQKYLRPKLPRDPNEYEESMLQIERLWHAAAPALLKGLSAEDPAVVERTAKALSGMRDERIVRAMVEMARASKDPATRGRIGFALQMLQNKPRSVLPERPCLEERKAAELYERVVKPALDELASGRGRERAGTAP